MRISILALIIALACCSAAFAVTIDTKLTDGSLIKITANEVDGLSPNLTTVTLKGDAHVKMVGPTGSDTFEVDADKIIMTFYGKKDAKQTGQNSIKAAELIGSPRIKYTTKDPSTKVLMKTTATSTSITYDGKASMAYLKGNVKIVNENPAVFDGPAVMTGDEATINLKPNLGPDETMFRIKSAPGVSRIEATPKEEEKTKK